jgi:hypothetical protein
MDDLNGNIRRNREDEYFFELEQERLRAIFGKEGQESATFKSFEALGVRDRHLVRELAEAGFDIETARLLYLIPVIEVAWSDGAVTRRETLEIERIAGLHGIAKGSEAHNRLREWLNHRPTDRFFQASRLGVKLMLQDRPPLEASILRRDLIWYCTRIAQASGGFPGLGTGISPEEKQILSELATELDERSHRLTS